MFNYPCYLPTSQQTGGAVGVVYMHCFRTGFEFPCVVPPMLTLSGPTTPLQPSCKGCLVAQCVFLCSLHLSTAIRFTNKMWIVLVRMVERQCAPTSVLQQTSSNSLSAGRFIFQQFELPLINTAC